jgi:hypothetical protein
VTSASIAYSIDARAQLVLVEYRANAGFEDWASTMEAILADPAYRPGFSFLVDRCHASAPTTADLHRMINFIGDRAGRFADSRWAIVTYSPADFGMARMTEVLAKDHPTTIRVFSDRDHGLRWLLNPNSTGAT